MDDETKHTPASIWDDSLSSEEIRRIQAAVEEYAKSQNVILFAPISIAMAIVLVVVTLAVFCRRRAKQKKNNNRTTLTSFHQVVLPATPTRAGSPFFSSSTTNTASPESGTVTPPPRLQERRFLLSRALSQRSISASQRGNRTAFHIPIFKSPARPPRPISSKQLDLEIGWAVSQAADSVAAESTFYAFPLEPMRRQTLRRQTASYNDESLSRIEEQDGVVTAEIGLATDFPAPKTSDDIPLIHAEYCYNRIQDNFGRVRTPSPARVQYRRGRVLGEDDLELLRRSYDGNLPTWK